MKFSTRSIVFAGVVAAVYFVVTIALAPVSYGPVQFRVSTLLSPLALFDPSMALAFAVGVFLSNLGSPFGAWDVLAMPIVAGVAAFLCWKMNRLPLVGISLQALVVSIGVAAFPLGLGGGLPFWPTVAFIFISQIILIWVGYWIIWRKYGKVLFPSAVRSG